MTFRIGPVEFRIDNLIGWSLLIITLVFCTRSVRNTLRTSVALANSAFQSATIDLQNNAQHESLILDQIVTIQGMQTTVLDMEADNSKRIKALEDRMGKKR